MSIKEHLLKYLNYNVWANKRLCESLAAITAESWNTEILSSFSSVRKTLLHLLDGQIVWLTRLNGGTLNDWPSKNFKGTNNDIIEQLTEQSIQFTDYFAGKSESYFTESCAYNDFKDNPHITLISDIVQHVMNHSTFHRGQLVTMLRQLGAQDIKQTDYITYTREQK